MFKTSLVSNFNIGVKNTLPGNAVALICDCPLAKYDGTVAFFTDLPVIHKMAFIQLVI